MLKKLTEYQNRLLKRFDIKYRRYLFDEIDFDDKMIAIYGARGVGKTTMLLQYLIELQAEQKHTLYISLDYPFLNGTELLDVVETFVEDGGEYLLLDEVHRYNEFSAYLKTIYDMYDVKVLYTSSSATSLLNAKSDLSRRVTLYNLYGFSFREFLEFKRDIKLDKLTLSSIYDSHENLVKKIQKEKIPILKEFKEYLKVGYYPFYSDKSTSYYENLVNTINLTIDLDLTSLGLVEQKYTYKLKKLLEVVCESKPFEVNYTKIAAAAEISRVKLYDYISYLADGQMLLLIDEPVKGVKKISKPAKIYLNNPNLLYAYCQSHELGTLRETFFANQLSARHKLHISTKGDFTIDSKYKVEIGSKNKTFNQIKNVPNSFIAADDIEIGNGNKIPLWLFGFIY